MTPAEAADAVAMGLGQVAPDLVPSGPGAWTFTLGNGRRFPVRARVDDGWLSLMASLDAGGGTSSVSRTWELLHANEALEGGARLAVGSGGGLIIRADVPLDAPLALGKRMSEALAGIEGAHACVADGNRRRPSDPPDRADTTALDALEEACRQTGWCIRRGEARALTIDLDVPTAFHHAAVAPRAHGVSVEVPLLDDEGAAPFNEQSRHALGLLLLRTAGVVRMTRAAATGDAPRFEVAWADPPSPAELSHAFAALSVACRLAGREAAVLRHDLEVATIYVRKQEEDS